MVPTSWRTVVKSEQSPWHVVGIFISDGLLSVTVVRGRCVGGRCRRCLADACIVASCSEAQCNVDCSMVYFSRIL